VEDNGEVRDDSMRKIASSPYFKPSKVAVVTFRHNTGLHCIISELDSLFLFLRQGEIENAFGFSRILEIFKS
jgi:hypothetical protein